MLSEILNQKQQYIKHDSITIVDQGITTLGHSEKFKKIIKLHLSGNKIVNLQGLQQFPNLQYLNLSNNMIDSIREFTNVSQSLQYLHVIGNPFTVNLNYGYALMNQFINLIQLDNEKINRQMIMEYKNKIQRSGFQLIAFFQQFNNQKLKSIFSNRSINYIQRLIQIIDLIEQDNRAQLFEINEKLKDKTLLTKIIEPFFKHLCKFERESFKTNTIHTFFVNQVLQSQQTDLKKFADDEEYYYDQIIQTYIYYDEDQQFPTFPLCSNYNLGILDFFFSQSLCQIETFRPQQERVKVQVEPVSNYSLLDTKSIGVQKNVASAQNQENQTSNSIKNNTNKHFDECTQEYLTNYKKQYPFLKGLKQLNKILKSYFLKELKSKIQRKIKRNEDGCISGTFKLEYCRIFYQRKLKKEAFKLLKQTSKLVAISQIVNKFQEYQKLLSLKHIKSIVYVQNKIALLQRQNYLKKLVLRGLNPYYRLNQIGKRLKLRLLQLKINCQLREAFKKIKMVALAFKVEIRKDLQFQITIKKDSFRESRALENFRKLRDIYN